MRTFIAVDLDREIKKNISLLVTRLKSKGGNIRWIKPQGMHLTLKFLGEISPVRISGIESEMKNTVDRYDSFPMTIKGTGTFPPASRNPRILWAGTENCDFLSALQQDLELKLSDLNFPQEKRRFSPHLTLGRVKSSTDIGPIIAELEKNKNHNFGEMIVRKITFFKSTLKPSGAEYSILSEFELK